MINQDLVTSFNETVHQLFRNTGDDAGTNCVDKEIKFQIPSSATFPTLNGHSRMLHTWDIGTSSLGSLNPELYKSPEEGDLLEYPEGHIGRLWFTVEFDKENEKLNVTIGKVRNLPSRDLTNPNSCDPFVRLFVLPDERRYVQTKVRRKTCNPNFGETFVFEVAKDTFEDRTLKIVAFDIDSLKRYDTHCVLRNRYIPIGSLQFNLKEYARCKQPKLTTWRDLKKDDTEVSCQLGELHCSLCYNSSLERLTVVLIEAKDLKPPDETEVQDTYGKLVFSIATKQIKVKKSRVIKRSQCPVFNESFVFKLPKDKLDSACICIQIMQAKPDRQIGRVTLAGQVFARGKPLEHWQEMIGKEKDVIPDWHYLTE